MHGRINPAVAVLVLALGGLSALGQQLAPAPKPCPASAPEVMLEVMVAEIDQACLNDLPSEKPTLPCAVMVLDAARCQQFFTARRERGTVRVLANPVLATQSGQPAAFTVGSEASVPVGTRPGDARVVKVALRPVGFTTKITPAVLDGPVFRMKLDLEQTALCQDNGLKFAAFPVPRLKTMRMETTAEAKPGQIVIVAHQAKEQNGKSIVTCITPRLMAQQPLLPVAGHAVCNPVERQIGFQVRVAEVEKSCLETLGLRRPAPKSPAVVIDSPRRDEFLQTRCKLGLVKLLACPNLITLDGQKASVQFGCEVDYPREGGIGGWVHQASEAGKQERLAIGLEIGLTPQILTAGTIRMQCVAGVSGCIRGRFQPVPGITLEQAPVFMRQLDTAVEVQPGQTAVLSGLTEENDARALLVFVTPQLVAAPPAAVVPVALLKAIPERWHFGVNDGKLAVRQASAPGQLVVTEMGLSTPGGLLRLFVTNGQVCIGCDRFQAMTDVLTYDADQGTLQFSGRVRFASQADQKRAQIEGGQVTLKLKTGEVLVAGTVKVNE
jgi:hypothetical protein